MLMYVIDFGMHGKEEDGWVRCKILSTFLMFETFHNKILEN